MNRTDVSPDSAILLWTIEFGSKNQILRLLEEEEVDLNGTNEYGDTVLHLIFRNKNLVERDVERFLKLFLDRGLLDPNIENKRGERILHVAVANRMKSVVDVLISYGADVDVSDERGNLVAHLFMQNERNRFLELLKLDEHEHLRSKVEETASEGVNFVKFLLEKGVDFGRVNKQHISALLLSIDYNLLHILLVLSKLIRGVRFVDRNKNTLLHLFLKNLDDEYIKALDWYSGYTSRYATKIVKLLLERGVSAVALDSFDETPLRMAIEKREMTIVEAMIDHHLKNCNYISATAVLMELIKCYRQWNESKTEYFFVVLKDLIAKGANVNTKDKKGMTPAYHAFHCKSRRAVDLLRDSGADLTANTAEGESSFHALARKDPRDKTDNSTLEALFGLLKKWTRCDLNAKNRDDETPLHLAAQSGNFAIVRKLVEHGAEVNCKNKYRETPVHLAVQCHQSTELVEFLLENGADVNNRDYRGRRPLLCAVESARDPNPLVPTLLKWGAYVNVRNRNPSAFCTAIKVGCSSNAKEMLAYGADINDRDVVDFLRSIEAHERAMKAAFVSEHWVKLVTAKLPNSHEYHTFEENRHYHASADQTCTRRNKEVHRKCLREILRLKDTIIVGQTSIYDFVRMDIAGRLVYAMDGHFERILDCQNLRRHFPMYTDVILGSYRETGLWKSLHEPAKQAMYRLNNVQLSDECCQLIFSHLGNQDLVNIIECDEDL